MHSSELSSSQASVVNNGIVYAQDVNFIAQSFSSDRPKKESKKLSVKEAPAFPSGLHINEYYVERNESKVLADRVAALHNLSSKNTTSLVVCVGMAGSGKTEIVKSFFHKNRENYKFAAWFYAENEDQLIEQYRKLAIQYSLDGATNLNSHDLLALVKQWLQKNQKTLLIYDNAESLDQLQKFLPSYHEHTILITSRDIKIWHPSTKIHISEKFTSEEAMLFFKKVISRLNVDCEDEDIEELCNELEYLPLALSQAAGYINSEGAVTVKKYLNSYRKDKKYYLSNKKMPPGLESHRSELKNCPDPVFITFKKTIQKLSENHPLSIELLKISIFFYPDFIPIDLLRIYLKSTLYNKENQSRFFNKGGGFLLWLFSLQAPFFILITQIDFLHTASLLVKILALPVTVASAITGSFFVGKINKKSDEIFEKRFLKKLETLERDLVESIGVLIRKSIFIQEDTELLRLHRLISIVIDTEIFEENTYGDLGIPEKEFSFIGIINITNDYYNQLKKENKLTLEMLHKLVRHFQFITTYIDKKKFTYLIAHEHSVAWVSPLSKKQLKFFYENFSDIYHRLGDKENSIKYISLSNSWNNNIYGREYHKTPGFLR